MRMRNCGHQSTELSEALAENPIEPMLEMPLEFSAQHIKTASTPVGFKGTFTFLQNEQPDPFSSTQMKTELGFWQAHKVSPLTRETTSSWSGTIVGDKPFTIPFLEGAKSWRTNRAREGPR